MRRPISMTGESSHIPHTLTADNTLINAYPLQLSSEKPSWPRILASDNFQSFSARCQCILPSLSYVAVLMNSIFLSFGSFSLFWRVGALIRGTRWRSLKRPVLLWIKKKLRCISGCGERNLDIPTNFLRDARMEKRNGRSFDSLPCFVLKIFVWPSDIS